LQLVELPAIVEGSVRGEMSGKLVLAGIRNADCVIMTIDISKDPIGQFKLLNKVLSTGKIRINVDRPPMTIEKIGSGNIQIFNAHYYEGKGKEEITEIMRNKGYLNVIVRFHGPTSRDQFFDALDITISYQPCIILATKGDLERSKANYEALTEYLKEKRLDFQVIPTSSLQNEGFNGMEEILFSKLGKIRVYTRNNAGDVADRPIILDRGSTVQDSIEVLSKKMLKFFRFARIWGSSKFDGEKVGLERELQDGDLMQVFA